MTNDIDFVEFYVSDARATVNQLVAGYGFEKLATATAHDHRSVALGQGDVVLVVTEPTGDSHPAGLYVTQHGDGVANIALRTGDTRAAFAAAVAGGAAPVAEPSEVDGCVTAAVCAFGDVVHTFVQRPDLPAVPRLPGFGPVPMSRRAGTLERIDHFAVCLPAGDLDSAVAYYEATLGFGVIFEERIAVGSQAMNSKAVQSASGGVTLTLIEPDHTAHPGQIDDFLKDHGGAGVQHIAFATANVVDAVGALVERGIEFLDPPRTYYRMLAERLTPIGHTTDELRSLGILVDEDHDGQLYQIFTRSTHPRRTFFFEVIERLGTQTFGSGNVQALYEAVEVERVAAQGKR